MCVSGLVHEQISERVHYWISGLVEWCVRELVSECVRVESIWHTRQSRPDSGLDLSHFRVQALKIFSVVPSSLGRSRCEVGLMP